MSQLVFHRLALFLSGLGIIVVFANLALRLTTANEALPEYAQSSSVDLLDNLATLGLPIVGGLVASRHPGNALGWCFLAAVLGLGLSNLDTLRYELLGVVDNTMQPSRAALWLRRPEAR